MRSLRTFRFFRPAHLNRNHSVKSALLLIAFGGFGFGTARALGTCQTLHRITSNLWKKGAAPGGAPASPSAFRLRQGFGGQVGLTPLPHSGHAFGLRPTRASPGPFLLVIHSATAVGRGGRGRVVSAIAFTHRIPRPPGHGASISQARCPRPRPPPGNRGSVRSVFFNVALRSGRPAATLRGKWLFQTLELSNHWKKVSPGPPSKKFQPLEIAARGGKGLGMGVAIRSMFHIVSDRAQRRAEQRDGERSDPRKTMCASEAKRFWPLHFPALSRNRWNPRPCLSLLLTMECYDMKHAWISRR